MISTSYNFIKNSLYLVSLNFPLFFLLVLRIYLNSLGNSVIDRVYSLSFIPFRSQAVTEAIQAISCVFRERGRFQTIVQLLIDPQCTQEYEAAALNLIATLVNSAPVRCALSQYSGQELQCISFFCVKCHPPG